MSSLACLLLACSLPQADDAESRRRAEAVVLLVRAVFPHDDIQQGAGIAVANDGSTLFVVTAKHLLRRGAASPVSIEMSVTGQQLEWLPAQVREVHRVFDLALVSVELPSAEAALEHALQVERIRTTSLEVGEPVCAIGYQAGEVGSVRSGQVARMEAETIEFERTDVDEGSSGGGLFDARWRLTGMVYEGATRRCRAIGYARIRDALDAWNVPPPRYRSGWHGEPLPSGLTMSETKNEYVWERDGSKMVYVPGGRFELGGVPSQFFRDGRPKLAVDLEPFYIDKYEVSLQQFEQFVRETRYEPDSAQWQNPGFRQGPDHPVVHVSLQDGREYAGWLGKNLPSERQWEKAAFWDTAASRSVLLPLDESWPRMARVANLADRTRAKQYPGDVQLNLRGAEVPPLDVEDGFVHTAPVDALPESAVPCGALNMIGNAAEWCITEQSASDYVPNEVKQRGPIGPPYFVIRGMSFADADFGARHQDFYPGRRTVGMVGFRCVVAGLPPSYSGRAVQPSQPQRDADAPERPSSTHPRPPFAPETFLRLSPSGNRHVLVLDTGDGYEVRCGDRSVRHTLVQFADFRPADEALVYVAMDGKEWFVFEGDRRHGPYAGLPMPLAIDYGPSGDSLVFRATSRPQRIEFFDGSRRAFRVVDNAQHVIVTGGTPGKAYSFLGQLRREPAGGELLYTTSDDPLGWGTTIVRSSGSDIRLGSEHLVFGDPVRDPSSPTVAYMRQDRDLKFRPVVGDVVGPSYDSLSSMTWAPSGGRVAYIAVTGSQYQVVTATVKKGTLAEERGKPYDSISWLSFSADGRHLAYGARSGKDLFPVLDGREGTRDEAFMMLGPNFVPDGSEIAWVVQFLEGTRFLRVGSYVSPTYQDVTLPSFLPGSNSFVFAGRKPDDRLWRFFGESGEGPGFVAVSEPRFNGPDSFVFVGWDGTEVRRVEGVPRRVR